MEKVLVAGATGYLGRYIIRELHFQGYYTVALSRNISKLKDFDQFINSNLNAKVTDPATLENICNGIDYVISSIGITRQKDGLNYMDVDFQANFNLLNEAVKSKVKKFIYISVLNSHLMKDLKSIEAKEKFVRKLKNSGIDYTVIKPNGFFSDMTELYNMAKKGVVYLFGDGEYKANPIHGSDLAKECVNSITTDTDEIDIGGPEILSQNQMAEFAFNALNKKVRIRYIPLWVRNILLKIIRLITAPKTYGPVEFFMTVMAMDMVAPKYGKYKLSDFYIDLSR